MNCGETDKAMTTLKALVADVPYSNKKLQSMDMEERYRFIISSIFHAIGLRVEVEFLCKREQSQACLSFAECSQKSAKPTMMAKGRIDMVVWAWDNIFVIELKLQKNGGLAAAKQQIADNLYAAPFQSDGMNVIPLAIELDDDGKGLLAWEEVKG